MSIDRTRSPCQLGHPLAPHHGSGVVPFCLCPRQHQVLKTLNFCQYNKLKIIRVVSHIFLYNRRLFVFPFNVHCLFFLSIRISSEFIQKSSLCLSCNKIFFFFFGQVTSAFKCRCETFLCIACMWTHVPVRGVPTASMRIVTQLCTRAHVCVHMLRRTFKSHVFTSIGTFRYSILGHCLEWSFLLQGCIINPRVFTFPSLLFYGFIFRG